MTTKEKIIRESIKRATKRLEKIKALSAANPLSEICDIRIRAKEILTDHKGETTR